MWALHVLALVEGFSVQSSSLLRPRKRMKEARKVEMMETGMPCRKFARRKEVPP